MAFTRLIIFALLLLCARTAQADELWLLSGDMLSGATQTLENGLLTFRTAYYDARVPWKEVAGLETAQRVRVTIREEGLHVARVIPGPQGYLRLQTTGGTTFDVHLPDVVTIMRPQSGVITTARAESGLLVTSGASDNSNLHLTGELVFRTLLRRTTMDVAVNQAKNQGVETTKSVTTNFRHQEFLTDHVYANGNVIVTNDRFRDITLRTAPGVGLGYQVSRFGVSTLSFDGGLGFVNELHDVEADRNYVAAREAVKFEHYLMPKRLQLFHQHDGYFGLASGENQFVRTRSGLRVTLSGGIIMSGELGVNYDRRPPIGQGHFDRTSAITLGYQLGH